MSTLQQIIHKAATAPSHACLILIMLTACQPSPVHLTIHHQQVLPDVPAASGITYSRGSLYLAGDNAPWLYEYSTHIQLHSKHWLTGPEFAGDSLIAKAEKPDFEALEAVRFQGQDLLILFGSGSKSPQRDLLVVITPGNHHQIETFSLKDFYDRLRLLPPLKGHELNLEGAAAQGDHLYLLNRGKNLILRYSLSGFFDFLREDAPYPDPQIFEIRLPEINGMEAGFSGATILQNKLIFTASVEDTPNAIEDGEILGSYVGIIDLQHLTDQMQPPCVRVSDDSRPLHIKVEAVAVTASTDTRAELLLVTDPDGGHSELLKATLEWK